ncbi:MAG TPA: zinc-ribbon domain-containing protein [Thermomicrobiales bacterium]|nr:zinc-ribbon domain-containing protein [Thermomicrobiales bacterium]
MYCPDCGAPMDARMRYCPNCGRVARPLDAPTPPTATVPTFAPAPPAPTLPLVAAPQIRTVTREYLDERDRTADVAQMQQHGWAVTSITHQPGKYRSDVGCLLALIFLPLAFFAGNTPDKWLVVYSTTAPPGQATLPAQLNFYAAGRQHSRGAMNLAWVVVIGLILLFCVLGYVASAAK